MKTILEKSNKHSQITYDEYAEQLMNIECSLDFTTHELNKTRVIFTQRALKAFEITDLMNLQFMLPKITNNLSDFIRYHGHYVQTWKALSDYENNSLTINCGYFEKNFGGGLIKKFTLKLPEIAFGSLCLDKKNFNKLLIFVQSESVFIFNNIETILNKKIGRKSKNTVEMSQFGGCQDEPIKFFSQSNELKEKKNLECLDNQDISII